MGPGTEETPLSGAVSCHYYWTHTLQAILCHASPTSYLMLSSKPPHRVQFPFSAYREAGTKAQRSSADEQVGEEVADLGIKLRSV